MDSIASRSVSPSTQLTSTRSIGVLPSPDDWKLMLGIADELVKSGLLPTWIKSASAALAVITKGRELGIAPMYALSSISMIQGRPTANAELMAALIYRDHGDSALAVIETTAERCTISYKRRGWPESRRQHFTYTIADAKLAGLVGKDNWRTYPGPMLRARCTSAVARMGFPDTLGGLYTPDEMGADVDPETGEIANWGAVDPPPATPAPVPVPTKVAAARVLGQPRHKVAPVASEPASLPRSDGLPEDEDDEQPWDDTPPTTTEFEPLKVPAALPRITPRVYYATLADIAERGGHPDWPITLADDAPDEFVIEHGVALKQQLIKAGLLLPPATAGK